MLGKIIKNYCDGGDEIFLQKTSTPENLTLLFDKIQKDSTPNDKPKLFNALYIFNDLCGCPSTKNYRYHTNESYVKEFKKYANIVEKIISIPICRTSNIIGEYAEWVACKVLKLKRVDADTKDYDAIDEYNETYQIKARWFHDYGRTGKNEFGKIRWDQENRIPYFDYFVGIIFDKNLDGIKRAFLISKKEVINIINPDNTTIKIYDNQKLSNYLINNPESDKTDYFNGIIYK